MIRVTVELVSAVHASRSRLLGRIDIANMGTGTPTLASYRAVRYSGKVRRGVVHVHDYPRKALGFWRLIERVVAQFGAL